MKVLIAESDAASFRHLQEVLQGWGYRTELAFDQPGIWSGLMHNDAPVIAIIDCGMAGLEGLEVIRNIRATIKDHNIYLIMLTDRTDTAFINEALEAGADNYITRHASETELRICMDNGRRLLRLEQALAANSARDFLTGLHNRDATIEQLKNETVRSQRERSALSIVFTDLDLLGEINERHGHPTGDDVLREVSRRLRTALRPYDHIGRYGGDELLMILPACNTAGALEVAERARMAVAAYPIRTESGEVLTSITSVTATLNGRRNVPLDTLLQLAETAMYRAKDKGRNQVGLANLYCSVL